MAVGDAELLQRKYDQQQQTIDSETALRTAQATGITGALDSENAVRRAQAYSTTQQGSTLQPLAEASIAATQQGQIPLEQAQAGLVGAQQREVDFGQEEAHPLSRLNYLNQVSQSPGFGLGAGVVRGLPEDAGTGAGPASSNSSYDPNDPNNKIRPIGAAGGATDVQAPKGKTVKAPPEPQVGNSPQPVMAPMTLPAFDPHAILAHATTLHAAGGATTVMPPQPAPAPPPKPGDTQTSGNWGTGGQNQNLRAQMGMGIKAAGGATDVEGASFAGGTSKVPGAGPQNVDKVPATLAPGEAVLNAGAAHHMGRGAISVLNAIGAHTMAAAGMPPQTPPTAHGMPAPARGAPAPAKGKGPPARGAPPAGKGNPFGGKKPMPGKPAAGAK